MKYRFTKVPRACPAEAYDSAARKIAQVASKNPDVLFVCQIGNVKVPGISDLDVVVVLRDGADVPALEFKHALTDDEKYTLMHAVFVVTEELWRNRLLFFTFENLRLLYGRDIRANSVPEEIREQIMTRVALQHAVRVFVNGTNYIVSGLFKVRSFLCELNAIQYDLTSLRNLIPIALKSDLQSEVDCITELRADWFRNTRCSCESLVERTKSVVPKLESLLTYASSRLSEISHSSTETQTEKPRVLKAGHNRLVPCLSTDLRIDGSREISLAQLIRHVPMPEKLLLKVVNRTTFQTYGLPQSLITWCDRPGDLPALRKSGYAECRTAILSSPAISEIRGQGYALPLLDFDPAK